MVKQLFIIAFALILSACGSLKKTAKIDTQANEKTTAKIEQTIKVADSINADKTNNEAIKIKNDIENAENLTIVNVEFATEKLPDSVTNLPPIKNITIYKRGINNKDKTATYTNKNVAENQTLIKNKEISTTANIKAEKQANNHTETIEQKQESKHIKYLAWLIWGVAISIIIITFYKILKL